MVQVTSILVKDANFNDREVATLTETNAILSKSAALGANASFTRAANTTAYLDNDVVGAPQPLSAIGDAGGKVVVTGGRIYYNVGAVPSGLTGFRLHLFKAAPSVLQADNDIFDILSADRDNHAGYIDFTNLKKYGSTVMAQADGANHQISLATADLYCVLTTVGAFAPASVSETLKVFLHTLKV